MSLRKLGVLAATAFLIFASCTDALSDPTEPPTFSLTILHGNDGNSKMLPVNEGGQEIGGIGEYVRAMERLRARAAGMPVITLSAGNNIQAGAEFSANLSEERMPYLDSLAMGLIGYEASAIGPGEFQYCPDVLGRFVEGTLDQTTFLSANLDFSKEPPLATLEEQGLIAASTVIQVEDEEIGMIGAITPRVTFISSPRGVAVVPDLAGVIQDEANRLRADGVNKILLLASLQDIDSAVQLAARLRHVDLIIAGGGGELLADERDDLVPGDREKVHGPYPLDAADADGNRVPVVTTPGNYRYIGRLIVEFDEDGELLSVDSASGPVPILSSETDVGDSQAQREIAAPLRQYIDSLATRRIGRSEVALDGRRDVVRTRGGESNLADLLADAILWQAGRLAEELGAPEPQVAIFNGGAIRNEAVIPAGLLHELDTFNVAPFASFVSVVPGVIPEQLKAVLENGVSMVEEQAGRFAQVSGLRFTGDPEGARRTVDEQGNVTESGSRIVEARLDDGAWIIRDGAQVAGAPAVNIATLDFMPRGGDQYHFEGQGFVNLGATYQQTLLRYIAEELVGEVPSARYPVGGEGRILRVTPG